VVLQDFPARPPDTKVLCGCAGTYQLAANTRGTIRCENNELIFEGEGRPVRHYSQHVTDNSPRVGFAAYFASFGR
jgi:hypothetical protein